MSLQIEDFNDQSRFRQIQAIAYSDLVSFVLEYLGRKTWLMISYWSLCIILSGLALTVRIHIVGYFPVKEILLHSLLGFIIFPILMIPVHEFMHVIPFWLTGAKRIRVGADLKQYIFYVTAHRHVIKACQFRFVALVPFIIISVALIFLIFYMPGLWKWSLSVLLFVHATMCAGDFAMLNFYYINKHRKIYTWDDADEKMAYFYEEI
ncbi:MAG: DUF3267 domain-containing protein [Bacteroidia bacterium]|nr:DUF3267 domain-containing protein [Bacteroidia bacterium]